MNTPDPRDPSADEIAGDDARPDETVDGAAQPEVTVEEVAAEGAEQPDGAEDGSAEPDEPAEGAPQGGSAPVSTAVFTRRRGGPTLSFWVLLSFAVPAVATLVIAPLAGVSGLGAVVNVAIVAALAVGMPLAALAALIDAIIHRKRR